MLREEASGLMPRTSREYVPIRRAPREHRVTSDRGCVLVVVVAIYHGGDLLPATAKPDGRLSYERETRLAILRSRLRGEEGGDLSQSSTAFRSGDTFPD